MRVWVQGGEVHLFYAVSRRKCWWVGEGGMHWACGGDLMMQSSSDSGAIWSTPRVRPSEWGSQHCSSMYNQSSG